MSVTADTTLKYWFRGPAQVIEKTIQGSGRNPDPAQQDIVVPAVPDAVMRQFMVEHPKGR